MDDKTCANCRYCTEVKKHPRNNLAHSKGYMHKHMGFACLLFEGVAVFMDHADGFCECFDEKEVVKCT